MDSRSIDTYTRRSSENRLHLAMYFAEERLLSTREIGFDDDALGQVFAQGWGA